MYLALVELNLKKQRKKNGLMGIINDLLSWLGKTKLSKLS